MVSNVIGIYAAFDPAVIKYVEEDIRTSIRYNPDYYDGSEELYAKQIILQQNLKPSELPSVLKMVMDAIQRVKTNKVQVQKYEDTTSGPLLRSRYKLDLYPYILYNGHSTEPVTFSMYRQELKLSKIQYDFINWWLNRKPGSKAVSQRYIMKCIVCSRHGLILAIKGLLNKGLIKVIKGGVRDAFDYDLEPFLARINMLKERDIP